MKVYILSKLTIIIEFFIIFLLFFFCRCWMEEANYNIILLIPVVGTVAFNIIFLCNILRVLYVKLRKQPQAGSGASRASLQALR